MKALKSTKKLTQQQISDICLNLLDRLPELLQALEIDYIEYPNRYAFPCPVHNGDNPEGCCIFTDGDTNKGNWKCWTALCEEEYTSSLFGFVRGSLSEKRNRKVSMNETADFCLHILDSDIDNLANHSILKDKTSKLIDIFNRSISREKSALERDKIRDSLQIPSEYFMGRGFSPEILNEFDIGLSLKKNGPMQKRVVVPIYDEDYNYVSYVGRAVSDDLNPKWLFPTGFKKQNILYGLNIAKDHIKKTGSVILVEGQGDVWRLHEAGYKNCVGLFGASIADDQLLLLESSGALNVIILTDSDQAGEKAYHQIMNKCSRRFNYFRPIIPTKDVGEMTLEQIEEHLKPQIERFM